MTFDEAIVEKWTKMCFCSSRSRFCKMAAAVAPREYILEKNRRDTPVLPRYQLCHGKIWWHSAQPILRYGPKCVLSVLGHFGSRSWVKVTEKSICNAHWTKDLISEIRLKICPEVGLEPLTQRAGRKIRRRRRRRIIRNLYKNNNRPRWVGVY